MADLSEVFPTGYQFDALAHQVEAQKIFFDGSTLDSPLADWAQCRERDFGETVTPEHLYIVSKKGKPHTVAWLNRSGLDLDRGMTYSFHHLACDCMPEAESNGSLDSMFACESLGTAIVRRAHEIRQGYGLPQLLPNGPNEKMLTGGKQIVISTMMYILEDDLLHPEAWAANYISGRHELSLLSVVLNREVDELSMYASMLEEAGKLEIENESTVRLIEED